MLDSDLAEKFKVFFEHSIDTSYTDSQKEASHSFNIIIPKQEKFKDAKIKFSIIENDIMPREVFLPVDRTFEFNDKEDTIRKEFNVKFHRNEKDDRLLTLKLTATDKDGKTLSLADSNIIYKVYIKPQSLGSINNGHEFWLFTGTNLDLLDGIKAKELYFKGSYLVNIKNRSKDTRSWMYITFGKNRFSPTRDSLNFIHFKEIIPNSKLKDSIMIVNGYHDSFREKITNNVYASIDYLYNIDDLSSNTSRFFFNGGLYFGLQTLKESFNTYDIVSDTATYLRVLDSLSTYKPLLKERNSRQYNYNISVGFTHILFTEKINVKSHFTAGLNFLYYQRYKIRTGIDEIISYANNNKPFILLRIDGTVLNPGISIGFETFMRKGQEPLFNVSLTKVLNIEQLSSLFGKI